MLNKKLLVGLSCIVFIVLLAGCSSTKTKKNEEKREIVVFAAASLTESMKDIKLKYEKDHPNVNVQINLGGSSKLRTQIEEGGRCDIFISADKKQYELLKDKNMTIEGKKLISNSMVLITPLNNPANINSLSDLTKKNKLIIADKEVPAGNYALKILENLNKTYGVNYKEEVLKNVASKELDVKKVVTKITLGEGDSAFVYSSDVTENIKDKVKKIEIPKEFNVDTEYYITKIKDSKEKEEVEKLYQFINSNEVKNIFKKYGLK